MKTQPSLGIVGPLVTSYLSDHSDRQFSKILRSFNPSIREIAHSFPRTWNEDYVQEGSIGLFNALQKYPPELPITEFSLYANRAIRMKMIDFYRSTVGKFLVDVDIFMEDGITFTTKQPCIIHYPYHVNEDSEGNVLENYTPLPEYASTLDLAVDLSYLMSDEQLKRMDLTEKEIRIADLYYKQGYNTSTVAGFLHTSVSNASKLISKANAKLKPYLLQYHSK